MRMKRGSNINFFNKDGEWLSEIIFLDKNRIEIKFINKIKEPSQLINIELAICLVKKAPMETILQKATELGVSKIVPIISDRTEIKELNFERANKIVVEATEQSNQMSPPEISKVTKLKNYIEALDSKILFFADVNSSNKLEPKNFKLGTTNCILIGPEGDFSPSEREHILKKSSVIPFSLSKNILRTDTAVISAISLVNFINNNH
jgi:16S rRNA (uracil1498-N3)-methyltransferase